MKQMVRALITLGDAYNEIIDLWNEDEDGIFDDAFWELSEEEPGSTEWITRSFDEIPISSFAYDFAGLLRRDYLK